MTAVLASDAKSIAVALVAAWRSLRGPVVDRLRRRMKLRESLELRAMGSSVNPGTSRG